MGSLTDSMVSIDPSFVIILINFYNPLILWKNFHLVTPAIARDWERGEQYYYQWSANTAVITILSDEELLVRGKVRLSP